MVPHYFQSSAQNCGAASLRMIAAALGITRDETTIAQLCGTTPLGCTLQDLVTGAQALGLNAELLPIRDESGAVAALSNQTPFVAMIDLARLQSGAAPFQWHFLVPLTFAAGEVTYHDPANGPSRRATLEEFLSAWQIAGYRGVRIWIP